MDAPTHFKQVHEYGFAFPSTFSFKRMKTSAEVAMGLFDFSTIFLSKQSWEKSMEAEASWATLKIFLSQVYHKASAGTVFF